MGFFDMYPMPTPNPLGKLFQRFTFDAEIKVGDSESDIIAQLTNFENHKPIRWNLEKRLENGRYIPLKNFALNDENIYIVSNTLEEISQGDYIWLKCPLWPQGKYFIVSGTVEQEFGSFPKLRKTFVHIPLKTAQSNPNK